MNQLSKLKKNRLLTRAQDLTARHGLTQLAHSFTFADPLSNFFLRITISEL
jgi:hypothetical protein